MWVYTVNRQQHNYQLVAWRVALKLKHSTNIPLREFLLGEKSLEYGFASFLSTVWRTIHPAIVWIVVDDIPTFLQNFPLTRSSFIPWVARAFCIYLIDISPSVIIDGNNEEYTNLLVSSSWMRLNIASARHVQLSGPLVDMLDRHVWY